MTRVVSLLITMALVALFFIAVPIASEMPQPQPLMLPLECQTEDCSLLRGAPQTTGMRSGYVRLKSGETVGWHTTGQNEEALVTLHGQGEVLIEGQPKLNFVAPRLTYIPPATRHNVVEYR
jgi:quercetin dioxygenase-like cupin family protein